MSAVRGTRRFAPLAALALLVATMPALAQDLLIRNATVHTATARGTLQGADVLVRNGRIAAVGTGLDAAGATVVEANGKPVTPALFAGITAIGIDEVSGEDATTDTTLALGAASKEMVVRPEFDVTLAYNADSLLVPVARVEGLGFTLLAAGTGEGGSIIGGQGAVMRLDGSDQPAGPKLLFVQLGGGRAAGLAGGSRAAQWMLLDQLVDEVRGRIPAGSNAALLTPAGRDTLKRYFDGGGRLVVGVDRAADIRELLRWSKRHGVQVAIRGGGEAWRVAPELAAARVPVFVDPLDNLPSNFDRIHAALENAARLRAAGATVGFSQAGDSSHNARKIRQLAGNAVAHGLPWEDGLAGLTRVPAEAFGVGGELGGIAPGMRADLVLWDGDPLDVASVARQVWFDGRAIQMHSRQTELRDRYLRPAPDATRGDLPRAYPTPAR
ncbi:amidohydrolase family protein [Luteimonas sp. MC1825]|uniref:amidohydrolase family protein n=1 Tax=Luteimonas sp. MC1825 TaxID=2761107 RepID=UPI00161B0830|nr:amidohydrolase family protein [Luteimonas sp. MC1825]MBB6598255.1 amidohydrolase family protein [Luteimonas sp. MC1825]QOC88471.1 amidohydrolase family protein [Luteimonas sp. MC1825]